MSRACPECSGEGYRHDFNLTNGTAYLRACHRCDGTGEVADD